MKPSLLSAPYTAPTTAARSLPHCPLYGVGVTGDVVRLHGLLYELQQLHLGEAGGDDGLRGTLPVDQGPVRSATLSL